MFFAGLTGDLCAGINGVLLRGTMGYFRRNIYPYSHDVVKLLFFQIRHQCFGVKSTVCPYHTRPIFLSLSTCLKASSMNSLQLLLADVSPGRSQALATMRVCSTKASADGESFCPVCWDCILWHCLADLHTG
jgi:hypothetical protein